MKRLVIIFGLVGGLLITVLKWTEYQFLVIDHSIEIYGGLTAATFAVLGIWLGIKLTRTRQKVVVKEVLLAGRGTVRPGCEEARRPGHHPPGAGDSGTDLPRHEQP
jgi:hypothetical protein